MILELLVGSRVYKVYTDEFCSLVFEVITACIYISGMMLKFSRKEKSDLEKKKEQQSFSKRKE